MSLQFSTKMTDSFLCHSFAVSVHQEWSGEKNNLHRFDDSAVFMLEGELIKGWLSSPPTLL